MSEIVKTRRRWTGPEKWQVGLAAVALMFAIIDRAGWFW
jgi:hypothetical protein